MLKRTITRYAIFVGFCLIPFYTYGQSNDIRSEIFRAYGFCFGQEYHLKEIDRKFPDLRAKVLLAKTEFDSVYGRTCKFFESQFDSKVKESLTENVKQNLNNVVSKTINEADSFLNTVKDRAKGNIPSPTKEILLAYNPVFVQTPEKEFLSGFQKSYQTLGHPKSKGVDFSVKVPQSWFQREGNRPNIIQFFSSKNIDTDASLSLMVKDIPLYNGRKLKNSEAKILFSPDLIKDFADGGEVTESKRMILEGQPAGFIVSDQKVERLDLVLWVRTATYIVFYNNKLIILMGGVSSLDRKELSSKFAITRQLFALIANSLVINDKYKK